MVCFPNHIFSILYESGLTWGAVYSLVIDSYQSTFARYSSLYHKSVHCYYNLNTLAHTSLNYNPTSKTSCSYFILLNTN